MGSRELRAIAEESHPTSIHHIGKVCVFITPDQRSFGEIVHFIKEKENGEIIHVVSCCGEPWINLSWDAATAIVKNGIEMLKVAEFGPNPKEEEEEVELPNKGLIW